MTYHRIGDKLHWHDMEQLPVLGHIPFCNTHLFGHICPLFSCDLKDSFRVLVNGIFPLQCVEKRVDTALFSTLHLPLPCTCSER